MGLRDGEFEGEGVSGLRVGAVRWTDEELFGGVGVGELFGGFGG